jgi:hypothetical protein
LDNLPEDKVDDSQDKLRELFEQADPEVKRLVLEVFRLENEKLYMSRPRIKDELVEAIKKIVQ